MDLAKIGSIYSLSIWLRAIIFLEQDLSNYKRESDADVKERILLVLNVVYDKHIPAQVARDLHRSRTWASDWLKRYREEGIEGLKNRTKSGRPPEIPQEIVYKIKSKLSSSKQGWTTKQVNDIIDRESGIHTTITFTSIPCFTDGDSNRRRYQEEYM